jgi:hypothetical protein
MLLFTSQKSMSSDCLYDDMVAAPGIQPDATIDARHANLSRYVLSVMLSCIAQSTVEDRQADSADQAAYGNHSDPRKESLS